MNQFWNRISQRTLFITTNYLTSNLQPFDPFDALISTTDGSCDVMDDGCDKEPYIMKGNLTNKSNMLDKLTKVLYFFLRLSSTKSAVGRHITFVVKSLL